MFLLVSGGWAEAFALHYLASPLMVERSGLLHAEPVRHSSHNPFSCKCGVVAISLLFLMGL